MGRFHCDIDDPEGPWQRDMMCIYVTLRPGRLCSTPNSVRRSPGHKPGVVTALVVTIVTEAFF